MNEHRRGETKWPEPTAALRTRYRRTIDFLAASDASPQRLLDLGEPNPLASALAEKGYTVFNTERNVDLDLHPEAVSRDDVDAVTAFEIFEHLVAPFNVLRAISAPRLFATVPLSLWFSSAYRNPNDPWDRHYHEFEDWQFDWLLEKSGWQILRTEKWTSQGRAIGIRPLLRKITPRYYAVEAVRDSSR